MKLSNAVFIYIVILLFASLSFTPSHITTNLFSVFQKDKSIQKLMTVNSFKKRTTLYVGTKGFKKEHLEKLLHIKYKLEELPYIKETRLDVFKADMPEYIKRYYYILADFTPVELQPDRVKKRLEKLKESLVRGAVYTPVDRHDPLSLFSMPMENSSSSMSTYDNYLSLGSYGYLLVAQLSINQSDTKASQEAEAALDELFAPYEDIVYFSTLFFTAQNSKMIKSSVQTILYLSFVLLIFLFFVTLRDFKLLVASSITLASSIFAALAFSTAIFEELSIFTLAFGAAISSISVDYLFHNYFHRQYLQKSISPTIFIAFFTTATGLFMLQFVSFPLISQLCVFALISLGFSYFQFTFIYPYFRFAPKKNRIKIYKLFNTKPIFSGYFVSFFSIGIIIYALSIMKFDYNLKNLDYNNRALKNTQQFFQKHMPSRELLLLESSDINSLIALAQKVSKIAPSAQSIASLGFTQTQFEKRRDRLRVYDFAKLKKLILEQSKQVGFNSSYFSLAYDFTSSIPQYYEMDKDMFESLGYEIIERGNRFYTLALVDKKELCKVIGFDKNITWIDSQNLLKETTKDMFFELFFYLVLALGMIFAVVLYSVKSKSILAISFILFPLAMILLYLSSYSMNIMHLFAIIVVIVAGIDYGIYMATKDSQETKEAVFYALLTSFSGFGILVLSSIGAMHSIGVVITVGLLSVLFLVFFLKM